MCCRVLGQEVLQAPYYATARQDTLNGASIKRVHNGGWSSCSSQFPRKVESLLRFFGQRCGVDVPGTCSTIDSQLRMLGLLSPEVHYDLLRFLCIQVEIVFLAEKPVDCHIVVVVSYANLMKRKVCSCWELVHFLRLFWTDFI